MKISNPTKRLRAQRIRRHARIRSRISGTSARPRLAVYRGLRQISAVLINDAAGKTIMTMVEKHLPKAAAEPFEGRGGKTARAFALGKLFAERARAKGVSTITFDRGGFDYHGRVRAFAEGARAGGLTF